MSGRFEQGDRVLTPDGPGVFVDIFRQREWPRGELREYVIVELDRKRAGLVTRAIFTGDKVNPEPTV